MAQQNNNGNDKKPKIKVIRINLAWLYIPLILLIIGMLYSNRSVPAQKIEWAQVQEIISSGDVKEIHFVRNDFKGSITIRPDRIAKYSDMFGGQVPAKSPHFVFMVSTKFDAEKEFGELNAALPAESRAKIIMENDSKIWSGILEWLLFPVLLILMWVWMFRGMGKNIGGGGRDGGGMNPFNAGKSRGKVADKKNMKVTFKDVAGQHGAKEEVMEIVDFLKNPQKYTELGARIPRGALLVGPPGTGKTLLAKAVAGEADVPFISISGSDFVEMFVGVGASRVRDLFAQAKELGKALIFIDEIDAVGRARGKNGGFSGNDERENTLNQLLAEMDGFDSNSGIIVLAATNRVDILDKALMRAGRFDRQIFVGLPELDERKEIFQVHLRGLKVGDDFNLDIIAKHTAGFSGADIANVCNEAALAAARHGHKKVMNADFIEAVDRIVAGIERKDYILSDKEKKSIAHHEAGHAVTSWLLPHGNALLKVTLIPRGNALGAAWYLPDERKLMFKSEMLDQMCSLIGGRVAEEMINGEPSTGAQNDLERLTKMAYGMIQNYGMNDKIGNVSFYDSTGERAYDFNRPYSEKTAEAIDAEVKRLIGEIHDKTLKILTDNKEGFLKVAQLLLEKETIFAEDVEKILGPKVRPEGESSSETSGNDGAAAAEAPEVPAAQSTEASDTSDSSAAKAAEEGNEVKTENNETE